MAAKDGAGCTALYCAAVWNHAEAVRKLVELGCPSSGTCQEGRLSIVSVVAEQGWADLTEMLVLEMHNPVGTGHVTVHRLGVAAWTARVCWELLRCAAGWTYL